MSNIEIILVIPEPLFSVTELGQILHWIFLKFLSVFGMAGHSSAEGFLLATFQD